MLEKTLDVVNVEDLKAKVSDVVVFGNGNLFRLISKASSKEQGWMKSTKAMETGNGVVVQVTTETSKGVAEAVTFVPGTCIMTDAETGNLYIGVK